MIQKLKEKFEETLEAPDPSWSQLQPQQEPENWERLLSTQRDYEGMDRFLFTENGEVRHVNGYQEGNSHEHNIL